MAYKINTQQIRKESRLAVNSLRNLAIGNALRQFEAAKRDMMNEFETHDVTIELKGGAGGGTSSLPDGNLISFIGLPEDPIIKLRAALEGSINFDKHPIHRETGTRIKYTWTFPYDKKGVEDKFPYPGDDGPWASGSWLVGIENGISGLRYYLFSRKTLSYPPSRSRRAIQVGTVVRGQESYQPRDYLTDIFNKFKARFR